nr:basic proline-rich protein-like isoform X2 [Penaeus vannamei]
MASACDVISVPAVMEGMMTVKTWSRELGSSSMLEFTMEVCRRIQEAWEDNQKVCDETEDFGKADVSHYNKTCELVFTENVVTLHLAPRGAGHAPLHRARPARRGRRPSPGHPRPRLDLLLQPGRGQGPARPRPALRFRGRSRPRPQEDRPRQRRDWPPQRPRRRPRAHPDAAREAAPDAPAPPGPAEPPCAAAQGADPPAVPAGGGAP